jgi:hypothetical protein
MEDLDKMKLPSNSEKEELETLSKNRIRSMLDLTKFEIREELFRDKGIDLNVELKYKQKYTNFRFLVQLKSTNSKTLNSDKSLSYPIETKNIQYLLNSGLPSLYIVYLKYTDEFYYEWVSAFFKSLNQNNPNWEDQESNTLRLTKKLDDSAINSIYQEILKKGRFARNLTEQLAFSTSFASPNGGKITIDEDLNITTDNNISDLIEKLGFTLINEGKSNEILFVAKKASHDFIRSSIVALILGLANYNTGRLLDAINLFSKAKNLTPSLSKDQSELLQYYDAISKYTLGFISDEKVTTVLNSLQNNKLIGYYFMMEDAKKAYYSTTDSSAFAEFSKEIDKIIENAQENMHVILWAKCERIFLQGRRMVTQLANSIAMINAFEEVLGANVELRAENARQLINNQRIWADAAKTLEEEITKVQNVVLYNLNRMYFTRVRFEMMVMSSLITVEHPLEGYTPPVVDHSPQLTSMLAEIGQIIERYKAVEYTHELCDALSLKIELLQFSGQEDLAKVHTKELEDFIDTFEFSSYKPEVDKLRAGQTTYNFFRELIEENFKKPKRIAQEYKQKMQNLEETEQRLRRQFSYSEPVYVVHLFPIGYFNIPVSMIDKLYDLLNIKVETLKERLSDLFKEVVPILNICNQDIIQEGILDGQKNFTYESLERISSIREKLLEYGFYRFIPKFQ